jgi:hypothetical protein
LKAEADNATGVKMSSAQFSGIVAHGLEGVTWQTDVGRDRGWEKQKRAKPRTEQKLATRWLETMG